MVQGERHSSVSVEPEGERGMRNGAPQPAVLVSPFSVSTGVTMLTIRMRGSGRVFIYVTEIDLGVRGKVTRKRTFLGEILVVFDNR